VHWSEQPASGAGFFRWKPSHLPLSRDSKSFPDGNGKNAQTKSHEIRRTAIGEIQDEELGSVVGCVVDSVLSTVVCAGRTERAD
jgi:hypothetical protein